MVVACDELDTESLRKQLNQLVPEHLETTPQPTNAKSAEVIYLKG
jgi:hypothetical protein